METRQRMLTEGLVAGLIGYATIAIFYAILNVILGHPVLYTAHELGERLVGAQTSQAVPISPVLAYNAVHLVALLVVGMVVSWLVYETERHPRLWTLTLFAGILTVFFSESAFLILSEPTINVLPWWSIVAANVAAGVAVGGYLFQGHRKLGQRLRELGPEAL